MKKILTIATIAAIAWACSTDEAQTPLDKLYAERDSLAEVQGRISERLSVLENQIIAQDSTRKLTTITALELSYDSFDHYFQVYGTIEASKSISVYPEVSGTILSIKVKEGQRVTNGQLLAELDSRVIEKNIDEVETNLELATTLYEKQRKLWVEEKIGSEVQYLQAKTNKESLESRLAVLHQQLRMAKVRAPFSGVVDEIFPKEGEMAMPGQPIVRLVNLSDVYLTADVSEAYVGTLKVGTEAEVYISNIDKKLSSKVIQVGQFINPSNRTFRVHVALDENSDLYKPNMMASIKLRDYHVDSTIVVPNSLLQQTPAGESFVYVVNEQSGEIGEIERRMVDAGKSYNSVTEVISGLKGKEILVNKGSRSVKSGQHVRIIAE